MWTDLFDDYGGMESGSHSLTLERLYAWEKKLYEEVKVIKCIINICDMCIACSISKLAAKQLMLF